MFELDWDEVTGRNNPEERYRIYRLHPRDTDPHLLATCKTAEDVGKAICEMAEEGQFLDSALGLLDTAGEEGRRWLIKPWLPGPATLPEAGRILRLGRQDSKPLPNPLAVDCPDCGQRVRVTKDGHLFKHRLGVGFTPDEFCEISGVKLEFRS